MNATSITVKTWCNDESAFKDFKKIMNICMIIGFILLLLAVNNDYFDRPGFNSHSIEAINSICEA